VCGFCFGENGREKIILDKIVWRKHGNDNHKTKEKNYITKRRKKGRAMASTKSFKLTFLGDDIYVHDVHERFKLRGRVYHGIDKLMGGFGKKKPPRLAR